MVNISQLINKIVVILKTQVHHLIFVLNLGSQDDTADIFLYFLIICRIASYDNNPVVIRTIQSKNCHSSVLHLFRVRIFRQIYCFPQLVVPQKLNTLQPYLFVFLLKVLGLLCQMHFKCCFKFWWLWSKTFDSLKITFFVGTDSSDLQKVS